VGALFGERVDIRSRFFRTTGVDAVIAVQRAEMVLGTRRGTYWKRPDYGLLVEDFVNADVTPAAFARLADEIKSALALDPLFAEATITTSVTTTARRPEGLAMTFRAVIAFAGADPIRLGINVSSAGVTVAGG
jgi:phage baseplate assembly protein W